MLFRHQTFWEWHLGNGISPEVDIEDQPNKAPVNKDDQVDSREAIEINTIQLTM